MKINTLKELEAVVTATVETYITINELHKKSVELELEYGEFYRNMSTWAIYLETLADEEDQPQSVIDESGYAPPYAQPEPVKNRQEIYVKQGESIHKIIRDITAELDEIFY